jgi:hypothetical protein
VNTSQAGGKTGRLQQTTTMLPFDFAPVSKNEAGAFCFPDGPLVPERLLILAFRFHSGRGL